MTPRQYKNRVDKIAGNNLSELPSIEHVREVESLRGRVVDVVLSDEIGTVVWSVIHPDNQRYWLDAFTYKREALAYCRVFGLLARVGLLYYQGRR